MYREYPSTSDVVACTWERRSNSPAVQLIVPDGCLDLVWFGDGRMELVGPDTSPRTVRTGHADEIVGIRFAPGTARTVVGLPISELRDAQVPVTGLGHRWAPCGELVEHLGQSPSTVRRTALETMAGQMVHSHPDALVRAAVQQLTSRPHQRVGDLADTLGISARHLQRRFVHEVGYGPKTFSRVVRLHRFLDTVNEQSDLSFAAVKAGYSSQSHLNDEFRALTSLTPVRFLEDNRRSAQ